MKKRVAVTKLPQIKETNMETREVAGFVPVINVLLSDFWVVLMFGLAHFGFKHHRWIQAVAKHGAKKKHDSNDHELMAVVYSAKTIGYGIVVAMFSYTIVRLIYFLLPMNPTLTDGSVLNYWAGVGFGVGVIGLIISGYSLIISAGSRWMVNTAKLVATASLLFMVGAMVATYL